MFGKKEEKQMPMRTMRKTFLVGRMSRRGEKIFVVHGQAPPPFPGPWTLRALVRRTAHSRRAGAPSPSAPVR